MNIRSRQLTSKLFLFLVWRVSKKHKKLRRVFEPVLGPFCDRFGTILGALGGLGEAKMAPETGKIEKTRVQKKVQKNDMSHLTRTHRRGDPWGQSNQRKN